MPRRTSDETRAQIVPTSEGPLAARDEPLLAEALRLAEEAGQTVENTLIGFGRWMLVHLFANDTGRALAPRKDNALWNELLRRAGGPSLRLSRKSLSVALHIAAHDHRIQDASWRLLEPGRKALLLPLREEPSLREAAQHVVKLKLSQKATRAYVKSLQANAAGPVRLTAQRVGNDIARFSTRVLDTKYERRAHALAKKLPEDEREAMTEEVARVRAWADRLLKTLREG